MITIVEKGLLDKVELIRSLVMLAAPVNPEVIKHNPLAEIPTLVFDNGKTLFDSNVICEYFDATGYGNNLIPSDFKSRIDCLRLQAIGDGLTEILLLWRIEMTRGSKANQKICNSFNDKTHACMATLEKEVPDFSQQSFNLSHITIICALGQLDFRYPECQWRKAYPELSKWLETVSQRKSVESTKIIDDGNAAMGEIHMPLIFDTNQKK